MVNGPLSVYNSGGSRGGGMGARVPLFLDQTEAQKNEKKLRGDQPPPPPIISGSDARPLPLI